MSTWVLQVSDLHFGQRGAPLPAEQAFESITAIVLSETARQPAPLVVALAGDIVDAGDDSNYDVAARALERHLIGPLSSPQVVCCPGNHDVIKGESGSFRAFNRFAFRMTNKADIVFDLSHSVSAVLANGYEFILANSMFMGHDDRSRGHIQLDHLESILRSDVAPPRILVTHHNFIQNGLDDHSALVNAFAVLQLAVARGIVAILHGHVHSQMPLTVGRSSTALIGVSSLLYRPFPNYNNGFNLLRFDGPALAEGFAFRYVADSVAGGVVGNFQKTELSIL